MKIINVSKKLLFTSPFSQSKIFSIFDQIELNKQLSENHEQLLFIVPTRRYKTLLERHFFNYLNLQGFVLPAVKTIDEIWIELIHEKNPKIKFEKKWQREFFILSALKQHPEIIYNQSPNSWIQFFSESILFWESSVENTTSIDEIGYLMENEWIDPDRIQKFYDFYQTYKSLSESGNIISRERLRAFVPEENSFFSQFNTAVFLSIDEWIYDNWKALQIASRDCDNVIFSIDYQEKSETPHHLIDAVSYLFSAGFTENKSVKETDSEQDIFLNKFESKVEEVDHVASQILNLHETGKINLHDICVVVKEPQHYYSWIQKIFQDKNLAFNFSAGFPVSETSVAKLVLQIKSFCTQQCDSVALKNYLSHPLVNLSYLISTLDILIVEFGEQSGFQEWEKIGDQFLSQVKDEIYLESLDQSKQQRVRNLQKPVETFKKVVSWLSVQTSQIKAAETNYKRQTLIQKWVMNRINYEKAIDREELSFGSWNALQSIQSAFEQLSEFDKNDFGFSTSDYFHALENIILSAVWNEPVRDGVQILGPLEVKGINFKTIFFIGLHSGIYPQRKSFQYYFTQKEIEIIDSDYLNNLQKIERNEFQTILQNSQNQTYLTFSPHPEFPEGEASLFVELMKHQTTILESVYIPVYDLRTKQTSGQIKTEIQNKFNHFSEKLAYIEHLKNAGYNTKYDGQFESEKSIEMLNQAFYSKKEAFSPTDFENYAACGFKYYLEKIISVYGKEEFSEDLDPRLKGNILHEVVRSFYSEWKEPITDENIESAWKLISNILDKKLDADNSINLNTFAKQQFGQKLKSRDISPLFGFLEAEKILNLFYEPYQYEWAFGFNKDENPEFLIIKSKSGDIKIKGRIDRIDKVKSGSGFVCYDYKTGGKENTSDLIKYKKSFQFPIYNLAIESFLGEVEANWYYVLKKREELPFDMLQGFWGTKGAYKKFTPKGRTGFESQDAFNLELSGWKNTIADSVDQMRNGNFTLNHTAHIDKKGLNCPSYCAFESICRKDENRIEILFGNEGEEE